MHDVLGYGDWARMNTPGTIGEPNWQWKLKRLDDYKKKCPFIKTLITNSKR
jgi:4-alpha-glucanotransferase